MGWVRRFWRWVATPIEDRHSEPVIRTPLDLFDEAIDYVGNYVDYLEMEVSPMEKSYYLHDEDDEFDWHPMQVSSLEIAVDLIGDVIARLEEGQAARLGQERATGADAGL